MEMHRMNEADSACGRFYCRALTSLQDAGVPFLVGGAYALERHTGIVRRTKDFDIFVRQEDSRRTLEIFRRDGYQTELEFPHWLGKAFWGDYFIDVIFNSGNGLCPVDEEWFEHGLDADVLGMSLQVCPVEEMIWQKSFILERDRCDTADVAHLLRFCAHRLDWQRLIRRFGVHWRVFYAHLVLFGFIYPGEQKSIPDWVLEEYARRMREQMDAPPADERLCRGVFLSATQYLRDLNVEGYQDPRVQPMGTMTEDDMLKWTANFIKP